MRFCGEQTPFYTRNRPFAERCSGQTHGNAEKEAFPQAASSGALLRHVWLTGATTALTVQGAGLNGDRSPHVVVEQCAFDDWCEKAPFCDEILMLKTIHLPRQARDEHRKG